MFNSTTLLNSLPNNCKWLIHCRMSQLIYSHLAVGSEPLTLWQQRRHGFPYFSPGSIFKFVKIRPNEVGGEEEGDSGKIADHIELNKLVKFSDQLFIPSSYYNINFKNYKDLFHISTPISFNSQPKLYVAIKGCGP